MRTAPTELCGSNRRAGPFYAAATPVTVVDAGAREIASFRSPRKLGKALISGELVLIAGDVIHIGERRGVMKRQQELAAASAKLVGVIAFLGAVMIVASILSFSLAVPDPSGYGVAAPSEQGGEADEL